MSTAPINSKTYDISNYLQLTKQTVRPTVSQSATQSASQPARQPGSFAYKVHLHFEGFLSPAFNYKKIIVICLNN